jgi:hypothetical protein
MDPVILGLIVTSVATVGAGAMQYEGMRQQNKAMQAQAQYNEQLAKQQMANIDQQTQANEETLRRQILISRGQNVARSGGLTGSSLDILLDNAAQQEMDVLNMRYQANVQKTQLSNEIRLGNAQAQNFAKQTRTAQAGAILGTGANIGSAISTYGLAKQSTSALSPASPN